MIYYKQYHSRYWPLLNPDRLNVASCGTLYPLYGFFMHYYEKTRAKRAEIFSKSCKVVIKWSKKMYTWQILGGARAGYAPPGSTYVDLPFVEKILSLKFPFLKMNSSFNCIAKALISFLHILHNKGCLFSHSGKVWY